MTKRLGISIYPEKVGAEVTQKYIQDAYDNGFTRIFANLLEIEDDTKGNETLEMLKGVYTFAKNLGFEVIVDVNPNFYKAFKLENTEIDFFKNLGATGIRLDEDFKGVVEAELSNNKIGFKIELNASATTETLDATLAKGGNPDNLIACHNFYPMRYTGLKYERFIQLSSHFQALGMKVAAFVTLPQEQNGVGPWDVNEGMPSLEEHRDLSLEEQMLSLLSLDVVDDIIISQQGANVEQFKKMGELLSQYEKIKSDKVVELKIELNDKINEVEEDILFKNKGKTHNNRPDYNAYFIRSTFPRIDYKDDDIKLKNSNKKLTYGDVVIVNENLGRYKGELHIITKDVDDSKQGARNHIGRIAKEDLFKLPFIKGGMDFKLIK